MPPQHKSGSPSEARFWDRYRAVVHRRGDRSPFDRWYVKRAEDYLASNTDRSVEEHTSEQVVFIAFCDNREAAELGAAEVRAFLEHLAVRATVAASTQNQALSALVFPLHQDDGSDVGLKPDLHELRSTTSRLACGEVGQPSVVCQTCHGRWRASCTAPA